METEIKEQKIQVLKRVPPGDRWVFADFKNSAVYPSLTDALEAWYQTNGDTQFFMDARKGTVEIIKQEEIEKPVKTFSLYGED
jgi:hypothetical protein